MNSRVLDRASWNFKLLLLGEGAVGKTSLVLQHVAKMFFSDYRIGNSHMDVPGPDGMLGWGGKCFPKDTAAAVEYAKKIGGSLRTVQAAREVNQDVRGMQRNPDWIAE